MSAEDQADHVTLGVIWVKKAKGGSKQWVDECSQDQLDSYMLAKRMKWAGFIAKYGLVLLTIFDPPAPCIGTPENCAAADMHVYNIGFPVLPPYLSLCIASVLYCIMIGRMTLRRWAMGEAYHFHGWHVFTSLCVGMGLITTIMSFFALWMLPISIIFRPLVFVGRSKNLRTGVIDIFHSLPGFLDVLFAFCACVGVFVWMGMVLFPGTDEGSVDFYSWGDGFAKLWTGYTTANSPNFYIPALNQNRWYFIFFWAYMLLTLFLLSNVLLAKVYDSYKDAIKMKYSAMKDNQSLSMMRAFVALADPATNLITTETWDKFFILCCDPNIGCIGAADPSDHKFNDFKFKNILSLFFNLDIEKLDGIDLQTFKKILGVIFDRDIVIPSKREERKGTSVLLDFFTVGTDYMTPGVKVVWDKVMDGVISVGTLLTFILSHEFAASPTIPNLCDYDTFWCLFTFACFYFIGLNTKIFTLGIERFWHSKPLQHRFDFANVYILMLIQCLYIGVWRTQGMARTVILLHMCRALRLFVYIGPLQQLFVIIKQLIPTFRQTLMILLVVYYIFSVIGRWCFGGLIYTTNPALADTGFAQGLYWSLTFNDLVSGMITLFLIMLVNNWYIVANGYLLSSGTIWCGIFFFAWYVVANFVMINIVVAVILDGTGIVSAQLAEQAKKKAETGRSSGSGGGGIEEAWKEEMLQRVAGDFSSQYMMRQILDEEDDVFGGGGTSGSQSMALAATTDDIDSSPSRRKRGTVL